MKTMVIDTSTQLLIVSFVEDDKVLYEVKKVGNNNHSDNLLKQIEIGLKATNLGVVDFNRIIVGIGPGAYTGLRVSLTVAKMFCWTLNIPLYTVSSLDLLASGHFRTDGRYAVMMKAKKDYVYGKIFAVKAGVEVTLEPEVFMERNSFLEVIEKYQQIKIIDEDAINYLSLNLDDNKLLLVEDSSFLEPNYLRGAM